MAPVYKPLNGRRFVAFAASAFALSLAITLLGLLAVDAYLHHRAERSAGLNYRGYRGPVAGKKHPGEVRIAVLGGSTVFGYGSPWYEAFPALLEGVLNQKEPTPKWRAINLGFNAEGVHALSPTLDDFAYLDIDVAIFYVGYNDMLGDGGPNRALYRRSSAVFRLTGYYPILPAFLRERALMLRYGDLESAYIAMQPGQTVRTVFRPSVAARASASVLEAATTIGDTLGRQLESWQASSVDGTASGEAGCAHPWVFFCDAVDRAVRGARAHGQRVIVASQPRMTDPRVHDRQRQALADMMARRFGDDPHVRYLDLGNAVDLSDRNYSFDQMHLGLDGNRVIASALADPVRRIVDSPAPR